MLPKMLTILDFQEVFMLEDPVLNLTVQAKIYIFAGKKIFFANIFYRVLKILLL